MVEPQRQPWAGGAGLTPSGAISLVSAPVPGPRSGAWTWELAEAGRTAAGCPAVVWAEAQWVAEGVEGGHQGLASCRVL